MLTEGGFNTKRLRKVEPGEREHIARLVPPETFPHVLHLVGHGGRPAISSPDHRSADLDCCHGRVARQHTIWHLYGFYRQAD